ncbi:MAG: type I restriction endonuclease subunit R [Treponema sp.]|nr:type I restriction endonuclease subunit R [Treponema sp.]
MSERQTQTRVMGLIQDLLGYVNLGSLHDQDNRNVNETLLLRFLKKAGYEDALIRRAVKALTDAASNSSKKLIEANRDVYTILRYGYSIKPGAGGQSKTVHFINWKEPLKNDFYIAEEVTVKGEHTKRPDMVVYINGIAVVVLELKSSVVDLAKAIRQNIENQENDFIKDFFNTVQLCLAANDSEGLRYGVINTSEKYYIEWKEDAKANDKLSKCIRSLIDKDSYMMDNNLISLLQKERLIDIIYNFLVFDAGRKKICRPNQYFGVLAAKERIAKKEGGIIWHTQGSGKSLTMVWLSRIIKENNPNARILIITDREELDDQLEKKVFGSSGAGDSITRAKSCADLIEKLNQYQPVTMCSLIQKFGVRGETNNNKVTDKSYENYISELKRSLPSNFEAKGEFYVFVDECHRTQSGKLHAAMKTLLPNAIFIGFTGTPLLARQKRTIGTERSSIEVFGSYIHTYKYDEAVRDKVVLNLRYEARDIPQSITSPKRIDEWFELRTKGLTDLAKAQLKQRWGTIQNIFSSEARLGRIVCDIILDMEREPRLKSGHGNALLVAGSIFEACKYYELFIKNGFTKCAIITSYTADISNIKLQNTGEGDTEELKKYKVYQQMLDGMDADSFERRVKKQFVDEPAEMKLLIVVDKLLTGFDAPSATFLYIDQSIYNHGLFQAICRVNRLDGEEKEYGCIIDYKDLFKELEQAVADYTREAFGEFDAADIEGLLKNRIREAKRHFEETIESLRVLCEPVAEPKDVLRFIRYFCWKEEKDLNDLKKNEPKRLALYRLTSALLRAWADIAPHMESLEYSSDQIKDIKSDVIFFKNRRDEIKIASGDFIDLKRFEPDMRHLLDNYIAAGESETLSSFDDMSLIELIVAHGPDLINAFPKDMRSNETAVAETIENNVRRKIVEKQLANSKYFEKMSALLEELIRLRKEESISYKEYLDKIVELTKKVANQDDVKYPESIKNSPAMKSFYDNIKPDEDFVIYLHDVIVQYKPDKWLGDEAKENTICGHIRKLVDTDDEVDKIFEIVKEQREYW